ncbi:hypothetical protein Tsubulata_033625 [Turnera subulata]|uniref:RING-type E3 ubiquitin transferase n=1 Tax=Turnera subulata TaxID=218843 RepID=A0A9Q0F3T5_9ROSI|nr:hypothetical protein Tsubulata_033625 [Turnera subulata]
MSLARRPRITVNGTRRMRTFHYFWCQNCQRSLRFTSTNPHEIFCPHCSSVLNHELDMSRPRLLTHDHLSGLAQPSPSSRLLDSLALVLDPPPTRRRFPDHLDRRIRWVPESANAPWITLQFVEPPGPIRPSINPPLQALPPAANIGSNDTFNDAQNEFTQDEIPPGLPGPPPAPASAIESLPMVKITQQHLAKDTHCPVCKEAFEVEGEVRELPCKHLYHSECILPWLNLHNTCPVCRYVLRDDYCDHYGGLGGDDFLLGHNLEFFSFEEVTNGVYWLRDQFFSLWPIRAVSDMTRLYIDFLESRIAASRGVIKDCVILFKFYAISRSYVPLNSPENI